MRTIILMLFLCVVNIGCSHKIVNTGTNSYTGNFVISFYSKGSGTNSKAYNRLKSFIEEFNSKNKPSITYKITPWGREGEKDFCFQPNGSSDFNDFIKQVTTLLKDEQLIHVLEHQDCKGSTK